MKSFHKILYLFIIIFFSFSVTARDSRSHAFRQCVACLGICNQDNNPKECKRVCYQMKAQQCSLDGYGPGPKTTCDCS